MSADTLAGRIRERATEYRLENQMFDGGIGIRRFRADEVEDLMAAFALSELSAAEKAEREQCCKDVCEDCKEGSEPNLISGVWQHHYQGEDIPSGLQGQKFNDRVEICKAAAILNRE